MTGNEAIQRVIGLLDRMENDPTCGPACERDFGVVKFGDPVSSAQSQSQSSPRFAATVVRIKSMGPRVLR